MLCTRVLQAAGLLLCLAAAAAQSPQQAPPPPVLSTATTPNTVTAPVVDMQLLTASSGWARTNTNLFFTSTSGRGWTDISPHLAPGQQIDAVQFVGTDQAWAVIHGQDTGDGAPIFLAMTADGGGSWSVASFPADQLIHQAYGAKAHMSFPDTLHGWVLLTQAGSSALSRGHLFATADGGKTWSPLPIPPVDGRIQFVSESTGWLAGGVHQDYLFRTGDGGQTWLEVKIPLPEGLTPYSFLNGDGNLYVTHPVVEGPYFETPDTGTAALIVRVEELKEDLLTYSTADGGNTWQLTGRRNSLGGVGPLAFFDTTSFEVTRSANTFDFHHDSAHRSAAIPAVLKERATDGVSRARFTDAQHGWLLLSEGSLLGTSDGGNSVTILLKAAPVQPPNARPVPGKAQTEPRAAQGPHPNIGGAHRPFAIM